MQAHEEDAWNRFCDVYSPLVFGWIRKAGVPELDAEDIVQEVFRAVFRGVDKFRRERAEDTFRGWLLTVTRNEIRAWYRRGQKHLATGEGGTEANARLLKLADWVDSDEESEAVLRDPTSEQELLRRAAESIKQDFEPKTWQAFWRCTVDGHAAIDVAKDLQMTSGAVRQAKFRILARLREVLE